MKLSNTHRKILKELRRQKIIFLDVANPAYLTAIDYLEEQQLVTKKHFLTGELNGTTLNTNSVDLYIKLTQTGEAEADNMLSVKLEKINYLLPLLAFILSLLTLVLSIVGII